MIHSSEKILNLIKDELGEYANDSGAVLYSGSSTLVQGQFYIIGLNPAGDPNHIKTTVFEQVQNILNEKPDYNSYCDEEWGTYKRGESLHQQRVQSLAKVLDMNIRNIFAANIIFIRSTKTATIKDYDELRRRCWKVHEYFLSVVQPKVILCLGCDENKSAFSELKKKLCS